MRSDQSARRRGPRLAVDLSPPPGAPARVWRAVRLARARAALGEPLGRHLVAVRAREGRVELELAGSGWERCLDPADGRLRAALGAALGAAVREVAVVSRPDRAPLPTQSDGREAGCRPDAAVEPAERLRALARRLLSREGRQRGEAGD